MAIDFEFVWWERLYELCFRLYEQIIESKYQPDVIVGVARGGWIPARILSDLFFTRDTANVKVDLYRGIYARDQEPQISQKIPRDMKWETPLLVDDISDTGDSLIIAREHLEQRGYKDPRTATMHMKPWTKHVPDYYVVKTEAWVVYPWELKEFTFNLSSQLAKKGKSRHEIAGHLFEVGVPIHYAKMFLDQWVQLHSSSLKEGKTKAKTKKSKSKKT
ncbi:MAG: phosphoribosyltransferase [Promethearchaeota archaeon]